jgi:DNA gyrase subunit B
LGEQTPAIIEKEESTAPVANDNTDTQAVERTVEDIPDTPAEAVTPREYGASDITVLEGLEAVRKRPGMYIGSTDSRGVNHLANEIIDNSTDEGVAGHATKVAVILHADGSVQVDDDGRGIPTDINAKSGISGVELVLTRLHAGGKFGGSGYKTSGGLHGVGASAVNALSLRFDVTVRRAGKVYALSFQRGIPGEFSGDGPAARFEPSSGLRVVRRMMRGAPPGTTFL